MSVMANNKNKPIQVHNLESKLHSFIVNGESDDFKINPDMLLHLAKITGNNGWLGWSIPTLSRSVRSSLMLELAFIIMKDKLSILDPIIAGGENHSPSLIGNNMQLDVNKTAVENDTSDQNNQIPLVEADIQDQHMSQTQNKHVDDKAEQSLNINRRNEIRGAFS